MAVISEGVTGNICYQKWVLDPAWLAITVLG
jgi:hypothetical protein